MFLKDELRLEIVDFEARAACIRLAEELGVLDRQAVARMAEDGLDLPPRFGILAVRFWVLPGERFLAVKRVRGLRDCVVRAEATPWRIF